MNTYIKLIDGVYFAKLPVSTAMDFASYFIEHGIPAPYRCYGYDENYRSIEFAKDAPNVSVMLAWIRRWEDGHEYCPFCGGVPEVYETKDPYKEFDVERTVPVTRIRCTNCQCMTSGVAYAQDTTPAWNAWDKRVRKG